VGLRIIFALKKGFFPWDFFEYAIIFISVPIMIGRKNVWDSPWRTTRKKQGIFKGGRPIDPRTQSGLPDGKYMIVLPARDG